MHIINGYVFDSKRLLVYKYGMSREAIDLIEAACVENDIYETGKMELARLNSNEMSMKKIATNNAGICLTNNCNLRCTYCGYSSANTDENRLELQDIITFTKDIIRKSAIKRLITKKNEALTIMFSGGGEPTYEWDLLLNTVLFLKQECKKNGIPINLRMTSNGVLNNNQLEFIASHFNHVMVSYDGLPVIQNRNRICPNLPETNSAVEHSIQMLARYGVPLTIRTTLWIDDFPDIIDMYNHVFSLVPENSNVIWSIHPVMYEGRAINHINKQDNIRYALNGKELFRYYIDLVEYVVSHKGAAGLKSIESMFDYSDAFDLYCGAHQLNQMWLLPNKTIVSCIDFKDDMVVVGKVNKGGVEYYDRYSDILLRTAQKKYIECHDCIAYRFCKGGCPAWHLRMKGTGIEPPECSMQKAYWHYVISAVLSEEFSFGWRLQKIDLCNLAGQEVYQLIKKGGDDS